MKKTQLDCVPGVPKEPELSVGHHLCGVGIEYPVPQTPFRSPWLSPLQASYTSCQAWAAVADIQSNDSLKWKKYEQKPERLATL